MTLHWLPEAEIFATSLDPSDREKETESCPETFFRYSTVLFPFISFWALRFILWLLLITITSQVAFAPGTAAVILALPAFKPMMVPFSSTLAILVLEEIHSNSFTGLAAAFSLHSFSSNRTAAWVFNLTDDFLTVTLHCCLTPLQEAVMVTTPVFLGFTLPLEVTSATLVLEDFHFTCPLGEAVAFRLSVLFI